MSEEFVPVIFFICTACVIVAFFYLSHKNKLATLDTIQKSVDSGQPLTPEMLDKISNVQPPRVKDLRRGVVLLALGLAGFVASFMFSHEEPQEAFRIISMLPLFVGAGFLLVWKMNRYKD
ncbi:MAG: hypothetical protein HWD86_00995 [Kangiellaceae bacterium]|nr:hypothetical protein [Kangiellaceae bacterium]